MRIAIIGAGNLGGALGRRWAAAGHDVTFGVREDGGVKGGLPAGARTASVEGAAAGAEVVVLAVPAGAVADAVAAAGPLGGKVVVDATNPIGPGLTLAAGPNGESAAERTQALVPGAKVVKAFNQTGANNVANPAYGDSPPVMFYAGD